MLGTVQHEYFAKTAGNSAQAHVLIVLYFPLPSLHLLKYNAWYEDHIDPWSVSRLDPVISVLLWGSKYYKQESMFSQSADLLARLCMLYVFQNVDQTGTPSFSHRSSMTAGSTCFYFLPLRRRFAGPSFQNTQPGKRCNILDPSS